MSEILRRLRKNQKNQEDSKAPDNIVSEEKKTVIEEIKMDAEQPVEKEGPIKRALGDTAKKVVKDDKKGLFWFVVTSFLLVPLVTSTISTFHVIRFFDIATATGQEWLSILSALAFEVGLLSGLIALTIRNKIKDVEWILWTMFILLTVYQCMGNAFHAYDVITLKMSQGQPTILSSWAELLWMDKLLEDNIIGVKRAYAWISGGIFPIISLGFWHLLAVFIKKVEEEREEVEESEKKTEVTHESAPAALVEPVKEPVVAAVENPQPLKQDFEKVLENKKKKVEADRNKYLPLLNVLFNGGTIKKGDALPTYNEFINSVNKEKFSDDDVKTFLTLCNYLEITSLSDNARESLMSYEEAKTKLEDYLSLN